MNGASLQGEGKLHLGYVYAKDPTNRTANLMVHAALSFGQLLDSWLLKQVNFAALRSKCFDHAVMRGSMMTTDELLEHYAGVGVDEYTAEQFCEGEQLRKICDHRA